MRALITGGAGFIGSHLTEALLAKNYKVCVIDDLSTGKMLNVGHLMDNPNYQLVVDSILNENIVDELVRQADIIYHLAAAVGVKLIVSQPVQTIETNIRGSEVLLKAANRWRKPVIVASTSEIYGKGTRIPYREDDDMVFGPTSKNRWSYACSKAIDEFLSLAYHREKALPVMVVRLFNTVGPRQIGQYGMVLPNFVQRALDERPLLVYGDGNQSRTFCSIHDVVEALVTLSGHKAAWGQVYNLGSQNEISIFNLAKLVKEKTGSKSEIRFLTYDEAYEAGFEDMQRRVPDISKINKAIGFVPKYSVEQIVEQVITYYKQLKQNT